MHRSDFNIYKYGPLEGWGGFRWGTSTIVPAGGGSKSIELLHAGRTDDFVGMLYNGRKFSDAICSVAARQTNGFTSALVTGVIMRAPVLFSDGAAIGAANQNGYIAGISQDGTYSTPVTIKVYRMLAGTVTQLTSFSLSDVVDNFFVQFGFRITNDISDNVVIEYARNTGSALETPGGPNWSSWSTVFTDTGHGGVLNQPGYFGMAYGPYAFNGFGKEQTWLDNFRIEELI